MNFATHGIVALVLDFTHIPTDQSVGFHVKVSFLEEWPNMVFRLKFQWPERGEKM